MSAKRKADKIENDNNDTKVPVKKSGKFLGDVSFKNVDDSTFPPSDPDGIKACFLLCAVGPPGSGKTYALVSYIAKLVEKKDIHKIYVLSPTWHNNRGYFYETDPKTKLEKQKFDVPYEICDDMKQSWGFIKKIEEEQLKYKEIWKEIKKEYDTLPKFEKFVRFIQKNEEIKAVANMRHPNYNGSLPFSLEERAKQYLDQKGIKEKLNLLPLSEYILTCIKQMGGIKEFYEKPPISLLFSDDIQGTKLMSYSGTNPFMNFLIKHRHFFCNVMFGVHSIANGLPTTVRAQITDWMVFRMKNPKLIERVHDEVVGNESNYNDFENFYTHHIDGENNRFLMVNKKEKPIQGRLGWGNKGEKLSLKEMIQKHKENKKNKENNEEGKQPFFFSKGSKKHQIYVNIQEPINRINQCHKTIALAQSSK